MIKKVPKIWGIESWLVNNESYCGKFLFLKKGYSSSFHCHKQKKETFIVLAGKILLKWDDNDTFEEKTLILLTGDMITFTPGTYHSFTGIRDSTILEVSTHHDDHDVIREQKSCKKTVVYVDFDGFLCTEEKGNYRKCKPITDNIHKINKKYEDGDLIYIWTARGTTTGTDWSKLTLKQLKKWKVKYHDLLFDKPYYDEIYDDKTKM